MLSAALLMVLLLCKVKSVHAFSVELQYTVAKKAKFFIGCEKMCNFFLRAGGWGWGTLRCGARPEIEK